MEFEDVSKKLIAMICAPFRDRVGRISFYGRASAKALLEELGNKNASENTCRILHEASLSRCIRGWRKLNLDVAVLLDAAPAGKDTFSFLPQKQLRFLPFIAAIAKLLKMI